MFNFLSSVRRSNNELTKPKITVGDVVHYHDPLVVAGSPGSKRTSVIKKIIPGSRVLLENNISLGGFTSFMKDGTDNYLYLEDYDLSECDNNSSSTDKLSSKGTHVGTIVYKDMEKARKVMVESNIPVNFLS